MSHNAHVRTSTIDTTGTLPGVDPEPESNVPDSPVDDSEFDLISLLGLTETIRESVTRTREAISYDDRTRAVATALAKAARTALVKDSRAIVRIERDAHGNMLTDGSSKAVADLGTGTVFAHAVRDAWTGQGWPMYTSDKGRKGEAVILYVRHDAVSVRKTRSGQTITKANPNAGKLVIYAATRDSATVKAANEKTAALALAATMQAERNTLDWFAPVLAATAPVA